MPGKNSRDRKYLTEHELRNVFMAITRMRDFLIFGLIFEAGMRPSEIGCDNGAGIPPLLIRNIEDVLLGRENLIHLDRAKYHKNGRDVVLANPIMIDELRRFLNPGAEELEPEEFSKYITSIRDQPVFLSQKGNGISVRQIQTLFRKIAIKAGLPENKRNVYILRHTHAVAFLKNTKDLESLRQNLGHASIKTTAIYGEMIMDDAEDSYKEMYKKVINE
jgi:site-specific recombinase XerD